MTRGFYADFNDIVFDPRYADLDVVTDRVRSVRSKKWQYIRNFTPGISYYEQGHRNVEAVRAAKELYDQGKLPERHTSYFKPKPAEELYDLEADPFELTNLAGDASKKAELEKMRNALQTWIKRTNDSDQLEDPAMIQEMLRLQEQERKAAVDQRRKKGKATPED